MPVIVPSVLLTVTDLATYLHRTIGAPDQAAAEDAVEFARAQVIDVVGFDPATTTDHAVTEADVSLARGIAVRIAAQAFTNPQERQGYSGPEGLSYTGSPLVVGKIMSDADRKCLVSIQCRYAPGFA